MGSARPSPSASEGLAHDEARWSVPEMSTFAPLRLTVAVSESMVRAPEAAARRDTQPVMAVESESWATPRASMRTGPAEGPETDAWNWPPR